MQSSKKKGRRSKQMREFVGRHKFENMNILRYEDYQTLKVCEQDRNYYMETDKDFIHDVASIAKIRRNVVLNILDTKKSVLSEQQCDQIDFKARIHRKANIVNTNTAQKFQNLNPNDQCNCGCRRGRGDPIPFCRDEQTLNILGPGVLLMFLFKRAVFVILLMILIVYGIYSLVTNLVGKSASVQECEGNGYCAYKHEASIENKNHRRLLYVVQFWLGFAFTFIWVITLRFIKFIGKEKNQIVDKRLKSASDFAIKIQNLPSGNYSEQQLIDFVEGLWPKIEKDKDLRKKAKVTLKEKDKSARDQTNHFKMKAIQIIYNMEFSREMIQQIFYLSYLVDSLLIKPPGQKEKNLVENVEEYKRQKNKLKQTYELLMDLRKKFLNDPDFRRKISTTCCIIQFGKQKKRKQLLQYFGKEKVGLITKLQMKIKNFFSSGEKGLIFKGHVLELERAPEPSDILWTNCQKNFQLRRMIAIYTVTLVIVLVSFGILVGLDFLQDYVKRHPDKYDESDLTIINIAMSAGLLIVNKFLWFSLFYLLEIEYNHTLTEKIISQMNKVLFASSVNVIVLPIISNYVIKGNLYGSDGLSGLVFDYHIGVIGGLAVKLFDPLFLIKKLVIEVRCIRNYVIRFLCSNIEVNNPQNGVKTVNTFYEGQYFDVAENYVYIIGAIIHAAFFCYLQPSILILVAIMVIIFYFINRLKLITYCKIPEMTELLVFETALAQAGMVPIVYGVGSIVLAYIHQRVEPDLQIPYVSSAIAIGIGLIGFFNPCDILNILTKKVIKCCSCLAVIPGEEGEELDTEDLNDDEEQTEGEIKNSKDVEMTDDQLAVQNKEKTSRVEVYYENSNSLKLLGFQKILKGQEEKQIMDELQNFCESFFPKDVEAGKHIAMDLIAHRVSPKKKQSKGLLSQLIGENPRMEEQEEDMRQPERGPFPFEIFDSVKTKKSEKKQEGSSSNILPK